MKYVKYLICETYPNLIETAALSKQQELCRQNIGKWKDCELKESMFGINVYNQIKNSLSSLVLFRQKVNEKYS